MLGFDFFTEEHHQTASKYFGALTWIYLAISGFIIFFFVLGDTRVINDFVTTQTFVDILFVSLLLLITLPYFTGRYGERLRNEENMRYFWLQDITVHKLFWIPLGTLGVFLVSVFAGEIDNPLLGIGVSGGIMLVAFLHTNSFLIPVLIHGLYNILVVATREGFFGIEFVNLELAGIVVPEIGISVAGLEHFVSESLLHLFLVAPAEESMKILFIAFGMMALLGHVTTVLWVTGSSGIAGNIAWVYYHTVIAVTG